MTSINTEVPSDWKHLSSGCASIDQITSGGLPASGITEIYGASSAGKTQLALQAALTVQLEPSAGGFGKGAVYLSTEDVFPSKRLHELSVFYKRKFKLETNLEDHIHIKHIGDYEQLRSCLYVNLPGLMNQEPIGLLIIDSIAGVFRGEIEKVDYVKRSDQLFDIGTRLLELSKRAGLLVLCINQVTVNLDDGKTEPALGYAWANLVTSRFTIARIGTTRIRKFCVVNSPELPQAECQFEIRHEGLTSYTNR